MATLYITELKGLSKDALNGFVTPVAELPEITTQTVAVGASSAQSSAFNAATSMIRVCSDVTCSIAVSLNPTAATTTTRLPADVVEYFRVMPGQKIAVIANT